MASTLGQKISRFFSYFLARYGPAIITLVVLAAGFYFYFYVIVSENESTLNDRNFRGLHRMATNISGKMKNYAEQNAENFLKALRKSDSTQVEQDYGLKLYRNVKSDSDAFTVKYDRRWNLFFRGKNDSVAYSPVKEFVEPMLRRDLFSDYLLSYGDTVLFDELNLSNQSISDYIKRKGNKDTSGVVHSGENHRVNIDGKDYILYLVSFIGEDKRKFTIGGYVPLEKYISAQRYIPTPAIIWLVIGVLLVILMFPLLKIFLMQRSEQMLARNAISSLAALHVVGAIVVLMAINLYVYFTMVSSAANQTLKELAAQTEKSFLTELDAALNELDAIDTAASYGLPVDDAVIRMPVAANANNSTGDTLYPYFKFKKQRGDAVYQPGTAYPYFKHIVWTDDAGQQLYRWTTNDYLPEKIDVSNRDYFEAVKDERLWLRNGKPYYLTGVSSWVSKEKLALISKPFKVDRPTSDSGKKIGMITLSGPFRSVFNALLPQGYGFCIVKESGDVLFHIDPNRSLNENLVEECSDNGYLQSLLRTRTAGYTSSLYSGSSQRFYVQPVPGTPYSVVTYRDMRMIWSEELDIISACSILCLMNLAVILVAILIIQAAGYRPSLLHNQSISFTWMRPSRDLKDAYTAVTLFFWISMMLQILFFIFYDSEDQLSLVGIAFSYSYLLLSYMYFRFAVYNNPDKGQKQLNMKPIRFLFIAYLFVAVIFTLRLHSGQWMFATSQVLLWVVGWLFTKGNFFQSSLLREKNFRWWYVLSFFSFMAATAITPMLVFYCLSFREERLLAQKHNQLEFVSRFADQKPDLLAKQSNSIPAAYYAPYHFQSVADSIVALRSIDSVKKDDVDGFEYLYRTIKPAFSTHSREIEFLVRNQQQHGYDFNWVYHSGDDSLRFYYYTPRKNYFNAAGISLYSKLRIGVLDTGNKIKTEWIYALLLIGGLLLSLRGFDLLLNSLIQKIFFDGYDNSSHPSESDLPFVATLPNDENIFINGPVNSGKHRMMRKALLEKQIVPIEKDLVELTLNKAEDIAKEILDEVKIYTDKGLRSVVLLRHFEVCMDDFDIIKKKLYLMETLLQHRQQIIILSSRSFDAMPLKELGKTGELVQDYTHRWSNAMNQFYNLYHHWDRPEEDEDKWTALKPELVATGMACIEEVFHHHRHVEKKRTQMRLVRHYLEEEVTQFLTRVDEECSHSDFLWSLRPAILTHLREHRVQLLAFDVQNIRLKHLRKVISRHFTLLFQQICLKIQSLATNYYLAIWQSLSRDEQRTLIDIGLDDMVNPANRYIASRLATLGLVKPEPDIACYQLMNSSFRNFIFTQLDKNEVKSLRSNADEKGSWNSFQLPVMIVIVAIGLFLFATQKDAFSSLITYLGAAAGGIAALLKVLGMIPSNKT